MVWHRAKKFKNVRVTYGSYLMEGRSVMRERETKKRLVRRGSSRSVTEASLMVRADHAQQMSFIGGKVRDMVITNVKEWYLWCKWHCQQQHMPRQSKFEASRVNQKIILVQGLQLMTVLIPERARIWFLWILNWHHSDELVIRLIVIDKSEVKVRTINHKQQSTFVKTGMWNSECTRRQVGCPDTE